MDFAFAYTLITFVTLVVKIAFVITATITIILALLVARDLHRMIKEREHRRNELH